MKRVRFVYVAAVFCCAAAFALLVHGAQGGGASKEAIARGEYLVNFGSCDDCHTPKTVSDKGPVPDMSRRLSGAPAGIKAPAMPSGLISPGGWGAVTTGDSTTWAGPWGVSFASNLTADKGTGVGNWTEASFVKAMRSGKHKGALRDIRASHALAERGQAARRRPEGHLCLPSEHETGREQGAGTDTAKAVNRTEVRSVYFVPASLG